MICINRLIIRKKLNKEKKLEQIDNLINVESRKRDE